ncbi:MAG TPA: GNAT family N-acetyltransferase [Anaerolineae bacterium]|nr:GNAT family N-acetyltransferase [Anaerolineae bacterium]
MLITIPSLNQAAHNGPRPINLNTDIPQIVRLLETVFGTTLDDEGRRIFSGMDGQKPAFLWRLNPNASRLSLGFVWEEDGRIVGNATVLKSRTNGRYLVVNVAVYPDYRRRGIAGNLMEYVAQMIEERGGRQILLQVVKSNQAALQLYQSLHYRTIGSMTTWYAPVSHIRELSPERGLAAGPEMTAEPGIAIRKLGSDEWQTAYEFDKLALPSDLNWPDLPRPDVYKNTMWNRVLNFFNGRQNNTWIAVNGQNEMIGLVNILSEWGRTHLAAIRIHPDWRGQLERPLTAVLTHHLRRLPRRNVRIDHPDDDEPVNQLLSEAGFRPRRTLTHMRLDL